MIDHESKLHICEKCSEPVDTTVGVYATTRDADGGDHIWHFGCYGRSLTPIEKILFRLQRSRAYIWLRWQLTRPLWRAAPERENE